MAAVVLASSSALGAGVPIDAATPDQKKAAQTRYEQGAKAFAANKFGEALTEFQASYDTVASPNAHFMMARALNESGDPAKAYNELVVVEREAKVSDKYATTLEQSAALRADLSKKVGLVVVDVTGASGNVAATVGGAVVTPGQSFAVAPGPVEVVVTLDGKPLKRESVTVAAGETHPVSIDAGALRPVAPTAPETPEPQPASHGGGRTGYWVAAGVLGAVAVGGFVMGAVEGAGAKSAFNDLEAKCPKASNGSHPCPTGFDAKPLVDSGTQKQTLANVGWAIGAVGAAGAVTVAIIGATRKGSSTSSTSAQVDLSVSPQSIGLLGRF